MNPFHEVIDNNYISSLVKNDNKFIYLRYIINKVDINNFDKIFNNYKKTTTKNLNFIILIVNL